MLKSILKTNKNINTTVNNTINKNMVYIIIILLIIIMLVIIFWTFLTKIWVNFSTITFKENFDPAAPPPIIKKTSVTITDNTKSSNQIDPNAFGTFFLTTENNINKLNIIKMGSDPSSVDLSFDGSKNTKLLLFPTNAPQTNPHKANIFPVNFTVDISFPEKTNNIATKYVDVSGEDYRNAMKYYVSPNTDISGNFIDIILAIPNVETPIYTNEKASTDFGYIKNPSDNNYSIVITENGNLIKGIMISFIPVKK
jgi:hypothetical protein